MKNFKLLPALILSVLVSVSCDKDNSLTSPSEDDSASLNTEKYAVMSTGNDAPSGAHYNLNIIGVSKGKTADMTGNSGGRIFVWLDKQSKIMLSPGDDFTVLDANGTDGSASFQLPMPDAELFAQGTLSYSIYARALGKPGGTATMTTCADADLTEDGYYEVCSAESLTVTRTKNGAPKFSNVSTELLTILIEDDITLDDGSVLKAGRYSIFDSALEDYFWKYDDTGLKLLQLRFYPIATPIAPQ
jgi:hypothetical protein